MWVWGCGGCGLIVMILLLVGGGMLFNIAKDAIDPDIVWGNIDEVLPFDERPTGYQAFGGEMMGSGGYVLISEHNGLGAVIFNFDGEDVNREEIDEAFSGGAFQRDNMFGMGNVKNVTPLKVMIDGRESQAVYLQTGNEFDFSMGKTKSRNKDIWVLLVNLTRDDGRIRIVEVLDLSNAYPQESDEEDSESEKSPEVLGQELADRFFAPFNPWE